MKKLLTLSFALFAMTCMLLAQAPQAVKYQSVIRNSAGQILANTNVGLRLTVLEAGSDVYQETYTIATNDFGLVNLNLGQGTSSDDFEDISWTGGTYALRVELDANGGSNYQLMGESSLLSVPFALHAESAEIATLAENVVNADDADADPSNEIQTLSIDGNTLSISGGNSVALSEGGDAVDTDQIAKVWANVNILGDSNPNFDSHNVTATTKSSTGVYVVSFSPGLFSPATKPAIVATVNNDLAPGFAIATFGSAPSQVTVRTYDVNGNLSDRAFSVIVFGE